MNCNAIATRDLQLNCQHIKAAIDGTKARLPNSNLILRNWDRCRFQKKQIYTTQLYTSPKFTQNFFFKFCSNYIM